MRIAYLVAILVVAGCTKTNDNFCANAPPPDFNCKDIDGQRCGSNNDCTVDGKPICKMGIETPICVQCVADTDCTGVETPVCSTDNVCTGCLSDDQCASKACLETGACADESRIIYVKVGGLDDDACGAKDNECLLSRAINKVSGQKDIVRLEPGTYAVGSELTIDAPMTLLARGSTFTRSDGPLVTVARALKLIGGTFKGPNSNHGIQCNSGGALEIYGATIQQMSQAGIQSDTCPLTISRSFIRGNERGGVNMVNDAVKVHITNNFISDNGDLNNSNVGGMSLNVTSDSVVEFNTVVDNQSRSMGDLAGGIVCESAATPPYNAPNNVVHRNFGGPGGTQEVNGSCTFQRSFTMHVAPGVDAIGFKNPEAANPDYHLTDRSPGTVRNVDECSTERVKVDFDGDSRPADGKCDLGADEYVPGQ